ncbi:hypothetical protein Tco_1164364 [Tanacetum coccineum]
MINTCLTGKTSGFDRPRYPVLQMLWGIITSTNVDYAKLMWEEFIQPIQTFLADKANLSIAPQKGKKIKPHVIPYYRFTKLIICHLGRTYNIHQRSASPFHLAKEDHKLGNLKFVPKGEVDEVFGMQIPKELITKNIRNAPYYNAYMEIVAKHDQKIVAEKGGQKKPATAKQPKLVPSKQSKPAPATKLKVTQEKPLEPSPAKHPKRGKVQKFHKGKSSLKLIDKDEEVHHEPEPQGDEADYDVERAIQMSKGKGIATDEQVAQSLRIPVTEEAPTGPSAQPEDDTSANIFRGTPSPTDAKTGAETDKTSSEGDTKILQIGEEQGEDVANMVDQEEKTVEINKGQAGSDPSKTPESRPPPERVLIEKDQARPDPGLSYVALAGPDPEPMHDDFVATVYPQVHESLKHPDEEHVLHLPQTNFKKKHKLQDQTIQGISSKVFTLELRDLPHKIDKTINESVKEVVQIALQDPLKECFKDLSEANMKEIIHDRMFKSGTYRSQPEHVALYEAFEASMERDNRDEFLLEKDKSQKIPLDEQDPPPPPPDSDLNKKKIHDSDASGSKQPPAPPSLVWKTSDTREAPSSSSMQQSVPHFKQPVKDVPIPDDVNVSYSEDTDTAHLPKIKTRLDWLKPLPEEERLETPEPDWIVPTNDLPEPENNWANAFANSYQYPKENKLLQQTSDMGLFIKWYCQQFGKSKLNKVDLEGLAYKIDLVNLEGNWLVPDMGKPLPLGGLPGQVTIQQQFFFNKDLEYLVSGNQERMNALSISKLKAAYYPDFGLEELVPSMWSKSE